MQPALKTPDIAGLLAETRAGLAHLRADELEALAIRAEEMLAACAGLAGETSQIPARALDEFSAGCGASNFLAVSAQHRLLGDLLEATGENLRVLRRARGRTEGGPRWAL